MTSFIFRYLCAILALLPAASSGQGNIHVSASALAVNTLSISDIDFLNARSPKLLFTITVINTSGRVIPRIRIGINTGEMVVGNMGGAGKFTYTVIGDSVNIASRLEGANREFGTSIMVTQATFSMVSHAIVGRELDRITVKGRGEPVATYELMSMKAGEDETQLAKFLGTYEEGIRWYRERAWDKAMTAFTAAHALKPGDRPSLMYIDRSRAFKADPPPASWNGSYVMETK